MSSAGTIWFLIEKDEVLGIILELQYNRINVAVSRRHHTRNEMQRRCQCKYLKGEQTASVNKQCSVYSCEEERKRVTRKANSQEIRPLVA